MLAKIRYVVGVLALCTVPFASLRAEPAHEPVTPYVATEVAAAKFEDRLVAHPDDFLSALALASLYARLSRETGDNSQLPRALRLVDSVLHTHPTLESALMQRAQLLNSLHRFGDAQDIAEKVLAQEPTNLSALTIKVDALFALGKVQQAAEALKTLVNADPTDPSLLVRRARIAEIRGDLKEAEKLLRAAEHEQAKEGDYQRELVWYRLLLGEFLFRQGKFDLAERAYKDAQRAWAKSIPAREHLAELMAARGNLNGAIEEYRTLVKEHDYPEFNQTLGELLAYANLPADAEPFLSKAISAYTHSIEGGEVHYYHHLASIYADSKLEPELALKFARLDSNLRRTPASLDLLAWALYRNGKFSEAADIANEAVSFGTVEPHLLFHAGTIFSAAGNFERGGAFLRQVTEVNPRYNTFHAHR